MYYVKDHRPKGVLVSNALKKEKIVERSNLLFQSDNTPTAAFALFLGDVGIPGDNLRSIDDALQARFFQTREGRPLERWELSEVQVGCPETKLRRHLRLLGFIDETIPRGWKFRRAAWPGALGPRAWVRLEDLIGAWMSGVEWEETVVHGGKRVADPAKEGLRPMLAAMGVKPAEEIEPRLLEAWCDGEPRTEFDVMRRIWKLADALGKIPEEMRKLPTVWVDAPMKPNPDPTKPDIRPNSEDVIKHWLATEQPEPGTMLVSSGAPYGMAQDVAYRMLLEPLRHEIWTFGHAAPNLPIANLMREVAGTVNRIRRARKA
jgi:hypothetical protein